MSQRAQDWLWHVFNDPMRDNPWSIVVLIILLTMALIGMFGLGAAGRRIMQFRRRSKETTVDDRQQAEDAIERARSAQPDEPVAGRSPEGNPPGSASYIETPNQQRDRRERQAGEPPSPRPRTLADVPNDGAVTAIPTLTRGATFDERWNAAPVSAPPLRAGDTVTAGQMDPIDMPLEDTGTRMQASEVRAERPPCTHCLGKGYVMTTNDLLRESIALVADGGDMVVKEFYTRLLAEAPHLASLFPPDLLTAANGDELSAGYGQRNRLLGALVALSQSYDPTDPEGMDRLDTALNAYGGRHAAFQRPDGTVSGASLEEYAVVKAVLFGTLVAAAGPAWRPQYTAAWSEAYDYAAGVMLAAQRRSGASFPRQARA